MVAPNAGLRGILLQRTLSKAHLGTVARELSQSRNPARAGRVLEQIHTQYVLGNRSLPEADFQVLSRQIDKMRPGFEARGLQDFHGHIGRDGHGNLITPEQLRFGAVSVKSQAGIADTQIYVTDTYRAALSKTVAENGEIAVALNSATSTLHGNLVLATRLLDERYEASDFNLGAEDDRVNLAWELLARADYELGGVDSAGLEKRLYDGVKSELAKHGLSPMTQQALAIRDGREVAFGMAEGQGANYLTDLKELLQDPNAKALHDFARPLFKEFNIDLDELLTLANADLSKIENYYKVNGVETSLPVIFLTQIMRAHSLEMKGFDFTKYSRLTGQSGGQPAAMFMAGAFDGPEHKRPAIPSAVFGYGSEKGLRNALKWMLLEGQGMQRSRRYTYDAAKVKNMEPLATSKKLPSATEIDDYFAKFHVPNMAISGIPFDSANPSNSQLSKVVAAINAKLADQGKALLVSNVNTGATKTGKRSHFILMCGDSEALKELAKLIILKRADGYPAEIQAIVDTWFNNPNIAMPITNTGVSFEPHNPNKLEGSMNWFLGELAKAKIQVYKPLTAVVHNATGENIQDLADAGVDMTQELARQQFILPVYMDVVVQKAVAAQDDKAGVSVIHCFGPGKYLSDTTVPAILANFDVVLPIYGMVSKPNGSEKLGLDYLNALDPNHMQVETDLYLTADGRVAKKTADGTWVYVDLDADEKDPRSILRSLEAVVFERTENELYLRLDKNLSDDDFAKFKTAFLSLNKDSKILNLLKAENILLQGTEAKNLLGHLIYNRAGIEYKFKMNGFAIEALTIRENNQDTVELKLLTDGSLNITEYTYAKSGVRIALDRFYTQEGKVFAEASEGFALRTRLAYAADWELNINGLTKEGPFVDRQEVSRERLMTFANSLSATDPRYANGDEAHPHFVIEAMWKGMMLPAFVDEFGLDFTRVIDEGKTIKHGVPIKAGDVITTEAYVAKVEDIKSGRRVAVYAVARNQNGEIVAEVISSLLSRIPTGIQNDKKVKVLFENQDIPTQLDFFKGKVVFDYLKADKLKPDQVDQLPVIGGGDLQIPRDLANRYILDPNRIHVKDLLAALAGFPSNRIMQGLGTLAYTNEQVINLITKGDLSRYEGIANLKFQGLVFPGDELKAEIRRVAYAEGHHKYHVTVKKADGGPVMSYELYSKGQKAAVIATGQGSQYSGMGYDLIKNPSNKEMLEVLQSWIPEDAKTPGKQMVNLLKEMNNGTQDTDKAQPMIMSYSVIQAINALRLGIIPDDAAYSGHSLGMWVAFFVQVIQVRLEEMTQQGTSYKSGKDLLLALEIELKPLMEGVCTRSFSMQKYVDPRNPQGMLAVIATEDSGPISDEILAEISSMSGDASGQGSQGEHGGQDQNQNGYVSPANYNTPTQVILAGHKKKLLEVSEFLIGRGFRTSILGLATGFHSALVAGASGDMTAYNKRLAKQGTPLFSTINKTIYNDTTAQKFKGSSKDFARIMEDQIKSPVRWNETVTQMLKDGIRLFIEVGPSSRFDKDEGKFVGKGSGTLLSMVQEIAKSLGITDEVSVIFANETLNEDDWKKLSFRGVEIGTFSKQRIEPGAKVAASAAPQAQPIKQQIVQNVATVLAVQSVDAGKVDAVFNAFVAANKAAIDKGDADLSDKLAAEYIKLGAGAAGVVSAQLAALSGSSAAVSFDQAAPDFIGEIRGKKKGAVTLQTTIADLNIPSTDVPEFMAKINGKFGTKVPAGDYKTVGDIVKIMGGGAAPAAGPSKEDALNKDALAKAGQKLSTMAPAALPSSAPVMSSAPAVSLEQINQTRAAFFGVHKADAAKVADQAKALAEKYVALGAGARAALNQKLSTFGVGGPSGVAAVSYDQAAPDFIGEIRGKKKGAVTLQTTIADLNIPSTDVPEFMAKINGKFGTKVPAGDYKTVGDIVKVMGGGSAPAAAAKPSLSVEDQIDQAAISQALTQLPAASAGLASVVASSYASADQVREVVRDIFRSVSGGQEADDQTVFVTAKGEGVTEQELRIKDLEGKLANIEAATSRMFVNSLTQPPKGDFLLAQYGQNEKNGARQNLMRFVAEVRNPELDIEDAFWNLAEDDRQIRINNLANQLDGLAAGWDARNKKEVQGHIDSFIKEEEKSASRARAAGNLKLASRHSLSSDMLKEVKQKAITGLKTNTIITGNVISIETVQHIPEYGSPHVTVVKRRMDGTTALANRLKEVADPDSVSEIDLLLKQGVDLRGMKVLVQQAGTISAPFIGKLLQLGADVLVTEFMPRNAKMPDGQSFDDFYANLRNKYAVRGARLRVLYNMQPGNPHHEKALVERLKNLNGDGKEKFIPEIYLNGAAFADYGKITDKGDPHTVLAILALSTRYMAKNLAALHRDLRTGKQVFVANLYSPNNATNLTRELRKIEEHIRNNKLSDVVSALRSHNVDAETIAKVTRLLTDSDSASELATGLGSIIPGSGTYPWAKAILGDGMMAMEAEANGLVYPDGKPILVEFTQKNGWGKSAVKNTGSIMSGQDFSTEELERLAKEEAEATLLTATGDEFSTLLLAPMIAHISRLRKGEYGQMANHFSRDQTLGFDALSRKKMLGSLMDKARINETKKHDDARVAWAKAHPPAKKTDEVRRHNDGSLVDPNKLNIFIRDAKGGRYAAQGNEIEIEDHEMGNVGYGAVTPLGSNALTTYQNMLARSRYSGVYKQLRNYDFFDLARSMGLDVTDFDRQQLAQQLNIQGKDESEIARKVNQYLLDNSSFQERGDFKEFEMLSEVKLDRDIKIEVPAEILKKESAEQEEINELKDATEKQVRQIQLDNNRYLVRLSSQGYTIKKRPDGSMYAIAEKGGTIRVPVTYKMPTTVVADLPGGRKFDFKRFGVSIKDLDNKAYAASVAKMAVGQIMMTMGGATPNEVKKRHGAENTMVAWSYGLADSEPNIDMTLNPVLDKDVSSGLMASQLGDAPSGQIGNEMIDAEYMALSVVAACSTGNANIVMAVREQFSQYFYATEGTVDWKDVFKKLIIAGGDDVSFTFNSMFGFTSVRALINDAYRELRQLGMNGSRPDDMEAAGFVLGGGGGGVAYTPIGTAKDEGLTVNSMVIGEAFRTDGGEMKAREMYGRGQRDALAEAWKRARSKLTEYRLSSEDIQQGLAEVVSQVTGVKRDWVHLKNSIGNLSDLQLSPRQRQMLIRAINTKFDLKNEAFAEHFIDQPLVTQDVPAGVKETPAASVVEQLREQTRALREKVKFIFIAHKTSTKNGDPFEENSVLAFLKEILPLGEFAHIVAAKAYIGHLLGGASGVDAALTAHILKLLGIPGYPNLTNINEAAGNNPYLVRMRDAIDLNQLYDPDTTYVVVRESAGFNAKNAAVFEMYGKLGFDTDAEAYDYARKNLQKYAMERTQQRAEREGYRTMAYDMRTYPEVPIETFGDLYELSLRSDAVAKALLAGKTFDFENITSWIYQFPVNKDAVIRKPDLERILGVNDSLTPLKDQIIMNVHNARMYAEAYNRVHKLWDSLKADDIAQIRAKGLAKGFDKQTSLFYGVSDGMGMRTLLALMKAGTIKNVVGVHFDRPTNSPTELAPLPASFNVEILKHIAAREGVNLEILNKNAIIASTAEGDDPLQEEIVIALKNAVERSEIKAVNFFDYVAFGASTRRPGDKEIYVPAIDEKGQLYLQQVRPAKNQIEANTFTIDRMGRNHGVLLNELKRLGFLGKMSNSFTADWWGARDPRMLPGVYGGANLGDAKNIAVDDLARFVAESPDLGFHGYMGYPAFMSKALGAIPGGWLVGLIGKRILDDQGRYIGMEDLATGALVKFFNGDITGEKHNKVDVEAHEVEIAAEIDRRFQIVQAGMRAAVEVKAAKYRLENPDADEVVVYRNSKLTMQESFDLMQDFLPQDYKDILFDYINDEKERADALRKLAYDNGTFKPLDLSSDKFKRLRSSYPFFARVYGKALNTASFAADVIEAGGVGSLAADDLSADELKRRIHAVKKDVGNHNLIVNVMWSNKLKDKQLEVILHEKPAAVSIGNGLVSKEWVDKLHTAGIVVIQLAGNAKAVPSIIEAGVDLVIAERNFGPGHINVDAGSDPTKIFRELELSLYEAKIPVIAGGGFVARDEVQGQLQRGVPALQLDDVLAMARESTYGSKKAIQESWDEKTPVIEIFDVDNKPVRLLNTEGARALKSQIDPLLVELKAHVDNILRKGFVDSFAPTKANKKRWEDQINDEAPTIMVRDSNGKNIELLNVPYVTQAIEELDALRKANAKKVDVLLNTALSDGVRGNTKSGVFLAGQRVSRDFVDRSVSEVFADLMGHDDPESPDDGSNDPDGDDGSDSSDEEDDDSPVTASGGIVPLNAGAEHFVSGQVSS